MKTHLDRTFYLPTSNPTLAQEEHQDLDATVYRYQRSGKLLALGFIAKQSKPAFHFSFRSDAQREEHIAKFLLARASSIAFKATQAAERKAFVPSLKVGDVLRCSWGYDQTNVDFYEVVGVSGKSVIIREIAQTKKSTYAGGFAGQCLPVPGEYVGEPMRKIVTRGNGVNITSYSSAYPLEKLESGEYRPSHWSADA